MSHCVASELMCNVPIGGERRKHTDIYIELITCMQLTCYLYSATIMHFSVLMFYTSTAVKHL